MQTWGAGPPFPSPIVPELREAAPLGPPRNSARRVGTGPRPLPKLGFHVCSGAGGEGGFVLVSETHPL